MLKVVHKDGNYLSRLITEKAFKKGEVVHYINNSRVVEVPTYQTVQISENQHIIDIGIIVYLNHSCNPNTTIDTVNMQVVALRDIEKGEEVNFFYPSTEWEMAQPFQCWCGAQNCLRWVAGAKSLSEDTLANYTVNPHILEMKKKEASQYLKAR